MKAAAEVEPLWTIEDVAKYLCVSVSTVRQQYLPQWQACGVHYCRLPRGLRFYPPMIEDWARSNIDDPAARNISAMR